MLGEDPRGKPVNLLPLLSQMAIGKHRAHALQIFGDDYATPDGSEYSFRVASTRPGRLLVSA